MRIWILAVVLAGCSGPSQKHRHPEPLSVAAHERHAQAHESEAAAHTRLYDPGQKQDNFEKRTCFDRPLAGVPTSGTENMQVMRPCWTAEDNPTAYHKREATRHLEAARDHRRWAAELIGAEKRACAGLGEEEISHSPFFHNEDIASVRAIRDGKTLRGATVVFRKVPGLSVEWMRRATRCHQARAAVMGYSSTFMTYCPLMLRAITVEVTETADGIAVTMRSKDDVSAAAILGRSRDLVRHGR